MAIGAALTKKLNNDNSIVYSLHGDGEFQEGQIWEALMFAPHNKVDNLICTIDYNNAQIDGSCDDVLAHGDLKLKIESFGWDVLACLRAGADPKELTAFVSRIWKGRLDKYSDDRAELLASGEARAKVEMSYIGG
jgi:transketolase